MSYAREPDTSTGNKVERTSAVFILPGVDDNLRMWAPLQEAFDGRIIDYLDWTKLLTASLADLAAHVLRQIENLSPAGEIRLVGYSLGGSLGYAVRRLCKLQAGRYPAWYFSTPVRRSPPRPNRSAVGCRNDSSKFSPLLHAIEWHRSLPKFWRYNQLCHFYAISLAGEIPGCLSTSMPTSTARLRFKSCGRCIGPGGALLLNPDSR